jgi:hypothetical protein
LNASAVKDPNRKHESADLGAALFWFALIGLALLIGGSLVASWLAVVSSSDRGLAVETVPPLFPAPGVEANQSLGRQQLIHSQRAALDAYGWTDREAGVARVPIERAMELMSPRHLSGLGRANTVVAGSPDPATGATAGLPGGSGDLRSAGRRGRETSPQRPPVVAPRPLGQEARP